MHGCGNDYIYINTMEQPIANPSEIAIRLSDRHKGIGSDGLVLIGNGEMGSAADFSMRIFNADGSEAMMCGNASRCVGKYLYERGFTDRTTIRLMTLSGIKMLHLNVKHGVVESVTVDMGEPVFEDERLYNKQFTIHNSQFTVTSLNDQTTKRPNDQTTKRPDAQTTNPQSLFVSMGNPHYVIFTDDVNQVETLGKTLECHEAFPERCNIEFATPFPSGEGRGEAFRVRVWERGSGITMACGTGACATAVAAFHTGRAGRRSRIVMDGGSLDIELRESDNHVLMTGPATFVFDGEIRENE